MIRPAVLDDAPAIARVHVDPWRRFHEKLGGALVRETKGGIGGKLLDKVAYVASAEPR